MARPKKYRTQQERRTANNASAQRYRNRNCDELKARRQEKAASARAEVLRAAEVKRKSALGLQEEHKRKKLERETQDQERLRARAEEENRQTFIKQAIDDAQCISNDYNEFVGNRKAYVDGLYHEYINSGLKGAPKDSAWFTQSIRPLEIMDKELRQLIDRVYRRVGPVSEWTRIKEIRFEVQQAVLWVNDLECEAMVGLSQLIGAYNHNELGHMRG
ncbi:hypothetical protein PQX77_019430 [Marasmius sp. AFHP31]|nr:hypothetical protein PQX77_019430 [Marasmius sp. AFHP31]